MTEIYTEFSPNKLLENPDARSTVSTILRLIDELSYDYGPEMSPELLNTKQEEVQQLMISLNISLQNLIEIMKYLIGNSHEAYHLEAFNMKNSIWRWYANLIGVITNDTFKSFEGIDDPRVIPYLKELVNDIS